jgi:hypothetical protein
MAGRGFESYNNGDEGIAADLEDQFDGQHISEPVEEEHIGKVMAEGPHVEGAVTEHLRLTAYVSLRQLMNDKIIPLRITEKQAQKFQHVRIDVDGNEKREGDITRAQITRVDLLGFFNGLGVDIAPQLAVDGGSVLLPPKQGKHRVTTANGHTYATVIDSNSQVDLALVGKGKKKVCLYENRALLPEELVKKWNGVSEADLDKGVVAIPGTDEKLLDLEVNEFYPEAIHAHQQLLEHDFPDFSYADLLEEAQRRKNQKVRVQAAVLDLLKEVFRKKGIQKVTSNTTAIAKVGVRLANPHGKDGSWEAIHAQLHEMGVPEQDIAGALDAVEKVSVTIALSAVVH